MKTLPTGFILMTLVLGYVLAGAEWSIFVNAHSFAVVVAGTLAVLFLTTPSVDLKSLKQALVSLGKSERAAEENVKTAIALSKNKTHGISDQAHPIYKYAQGLWRQGVEPDLFETLVGQKVDDYNRAYETAVAVLRNLAKYPPALGMTGTVMGLVTVFSQIAQEGRTNVGPALAVALTATFYGLLLANTILMPLADRLQVAHLRSVRECEAVRQLIFLVHRGEPVESFKADNGAK